MQTVMWPFNVQVSLLGPSANYHHMIHKIMHMSKVVNKISIRFTINLYHSLIVLTGSNWICCLLIPNLLLKTFAPLFYSCFSHIFIGKYDYLITHIQWWFLAFGSTFISFISLFYFWNPLHLICQQQLNISKVPQIILTHPPTSNEDPVLVS